MKYYFFKPSFKSRIAGIIKAIVVGLLVVLQMLFIVSISMLLTKYTLAFYLFLEGASIIVLLLIIDQQRPNSFKLAWISIILILPLTGHIMYILWGAPSSHDRIDKFVMDKLNNGFKYYEDDGDVKRTFNRIFPELRRMSDYMTAEQFPLFKNNKIKYYPMGEDVFADIIYDLKKAKKYIFIEFFIVAEGNLWDEISEILFQKAAEGVEVKFLYDDFGTMFRTPDDFKQSLEKKGIEVRVFNPIHKYIDKLYLNFRSHQKIVVIDGEVGYTGGMNLADEYINLKERFGRWKDTGVRIEGDAVWGFIVTFLQMWDVSTEGKMGINYNKYKITHKNPSNNCFCHVLSDGPANNPDNPIVDVYMQMIGYASKFVYITTPYLVIEDEMRMELIRAAKSGVDVRIITPSIPDKKYIKLLTEYNYGILLKEGVRIFEYQPGFIHAKMILNEKSAIVGSINMDYRSFYLHYECGVWMCDSDIVKSIKNDFNKTLKVSREITYEDWKNRSIKDKIIQLYLNLFQTLT